MRLSVLVLLATSLCSLPGCGSDEGPPEGQSLGDAGITDDNPTPLTPPEDLCEALLERVCGPGGSTCLDSGACQAALLIDVYEPERCGDAFEDRFVYPTCEANACTRLVDKVCGDEQGCADSGSCQQAMSLDAQLNDVSADDDDRTDARDACAAGLVDDVVFAPCS